MYYLISPAGIPNYGDELIAMTWLRYLAEVAPDADVVVDCLGPDLAATTMGALHPRVRFTSVLWQLCTRNWSTDPCRTADEVVAAVRVPASVPDLASAIDLLRRADVVHVLGGGFINGIWAPFVGLLAGAAAAARDSGARTAMTGQGLWPPAGEAADLTRALAGEFHVVDVRDAPSAEFLGAGPGSLSGSISHTGDDVFLGLGPHLYRSDGDVPDVMVSVQSLLSDVEPERLVRAVADTLKHWGVEGIGLLECAPDQDRDVLAMATRMLPVTRVFRLDEVLRTGLPAAPGQCWISTRFHPHLMAAAAGASGVALCVQPEYYATKHRSLIDGGSSWRLLDTPEVVDRPVAGGYASGELERLRAAKRQVAEHIYDV